MKFKEIKNGDTEDGFILSFCTTLREVGFSMGGSNIGRREAIDKITDQILNCLLKGKYYRCIRREKYEIYTFV
jgi:hypothetical protein